MAWTIILENENREVVTSLSNEFNSGLITLNGIKLLHYLDPYGDTIFNKLQMDDLIFDLQYLGSIEPNPLLTEIQKLAEKCKTGIHLYVIFYGD